MLLTRLVGLVGNVSKGREGRKIQRSWGARAVFKDLPGQLAFQSFLRHLPLLDPLRVVKSCGVELGVVGWLAAGAAVQDAQVGARRAWPHGHVTYAHGDLSHHGVGLS